MRFEWPFEGAKAPGPRLRSAGLSSWKGGLVGAAWLIGDSQSGEDQSKCMREFCAAPGVVQQPPRASNDFLVFQTVTIPSDNHGRNFSHVRGESLQL